MKHLLSAFLLFSLCVSGTHTGAFDGVPAELKAKIMSYLEPFYMEKLGSTAKEFHEIWTKVYKESSFYRAQAYLESVSSEQLFHPPKGMALVAVSLYGNKHSDFFFEHIDDLGKWLTEAKINHSVERDNFLSLIKLPFIKKLTLNFTVRDEEIINEFFILCPQLETLHLTSSIHEGLGFIRETTLLSIFKLASLTSLDLDNIEVDETNVDLSHIILPNVRTLKLNTANKHFLPVNILANIALRMPQLSLLEIYGLEDGKTSDLDIAKELMALHLSHLDITAKELNISLEDMVSLMQDFAGYRYCLGRPNAWRHIAGDSIVSRKKGPRAIYHFLTENWQQPLFHNDISWILPIVRKVPPLSFLSFSLGGPVESTELKKTIAILLDSIDKSKQKIRLAINASGAMDLGVTAKRDSSPTLRLNIHSEKVDDINLQEIVEEDINASWAVQVYNLKDIDSAAKFLESLRRKFG